MRYSKGKVQASNQIIVISIACLVVIISLLFQLLSGAYTWSENLQSQMKVYVYLDDSLQSNQIDSTINAFKLRKEVEAQNIKLVSKQNIADEFLKSSHENYEELLGDANPFKNLLVLDIKPTFKNKIAFEKLTAELKASPGIYDVTYPTNYLELIIPKIKLISSAAFILIALLALVVYLQISNYTKLHIHANRSLIKSMQLLGSTNSFIKKPYLLKSVILGIIGSLLGYILINIFYFYLTNQLVELTPYLFNVNTQLTLLVGTLLVSVLFSFFSTVLTLNKYLKISASNLY